MYHPFAVSLGADQDAGFRIFDRASHNFGGAGRGPVDQHHQRHFQTVFFSVVSLVFAGTVVDVHDRAGAQEEVGHLDRRHQVTARVVTQVQDQAAQAALKAVQQVGQLTARLFGELTDDHIADPTVLEFPLHRRNLDLPPDHHKLQRFPATVPPNRKPHLSAHLAAHQHHRGFQVHIPGILAVHGQDHISGPKPGLGRGGALVRADHGQPFVTVPDQDPDAAEGALHLFHKPGVGFRLQVYRIRVVQGLHHAADGAFNHPLAVHRLQVLGVHQANHLDQVAQLFEVGKHREVQDDDRPDQE